MTSRSSDRKYGSYRVDYGVARARDIAFDAVMTLWRKRRAQGLKQSEIASILNRDPAWVSRQLRGPGNWTLRTIGELVAALDGELEIRVFPLVEPISPQPNYDAYCDYNENYLQEKSISSMNARPAASDNVAVSKLVPTT